MAPGKSVPKVIFLFLHTSIEFVMADLPGAMNDVRGTVVGLTAYKGFGNYRTYASICFGE